jgi:hypothetical protein
MSDAVQKCPVCGRMSVDAQAASCPQCNADLSCFKVLNALVNDQNSVQTDAGDMAAQRDAKLDRIIAGVEKTATVIEAINHNRNSKTQVAEPDKSQREGYFKFNFILSVVTLIALGAIFLAGFIMFDRVKVLEQRLTDFTKNNQAELSHLSNELTILKSKYCTINQTIELELLQQELKYNRQLNQKSAILMERIAEIKKTIQQSKEQINSDQLNELFKRQQLAIKEQLLRQEQQQKMLNDSDTELRELITDVVSTIKAIKKAQSAENENLSEALKQQHVKLKKVLEQMEHKLKNNETRRKAFFSFFKIRFF